MIGLYGKTHFELDEFIDLTEFDNIQLDIFRGIAIAKSLADHGYLISMKMYNDEDLSSTLSVLPLMDAYRDFLSLPENNDVKIIGDKIYREHGYNALATFLKYTYKAHDLCSHYLFWDYHPNWRLNKHNRQLTKLSEHFSPLINYIDSLIRKEIFINIGRAYLISFDSKGHSFEHRDPHLDPDVSEDVFPEFIHIRPNTKRPFYIFDHEKNKKHYVMSRIGWWNDRDIHGGEAISEPTYAIRIDGIFTDKFKKQLCIL